MTTSLVAQTKPVCDNIAEIPNEFSFNFFVILDSENLNDISIGNDQRFRLDIATDSINGDILYEQFHNEPSSNNTSFIGIQLENTGTRINNLTNYINDNPDSQYYANLYYYNGSQYILVGTQSISAVPYAQVSGVLGGMGKAGAQGIQGPEGPQGPQGPNANTGSQGPQGPSGKDGTNATFDFENNLLPMTSAEPTDGTFYVDDGTNTNDGQPHLRYFINGIWIDL